MPKDKRRQGYRKKLRYNSNRLVRKIALKQTSSQLADNNAYDPQNPQIMTATQNSTDIGNGNGDSDKSINPITFLNTLHHKLKTPNPPHYDCIPDPQGGGFYCTLMFFDQTFKSTVPKPKKQLAKEAVATIAMESFEKQMSKTFQQVRQTLLSANSAPKKQSKLSKG
ncbi:12218_t:CDS:1, partial [Racocetra persica]